MKVSWNMPNRPKLLRSAPMAAGRAMAPSTSVMAETLSKKSAPASDADGTMVTQPQQAQPVTKDPKPKVDVKAPATIDHPEKDHTNLLILLGVAALLASGFFLILQRRKRSQ